MYRFFTMDKIGQITNKVKIDMQVLLEAYSLLQRIKYLYGEHMKLLSKGKCALDKTIRFVSLPNLECHQKIARVIGKNAHKVIQNYIFDT
jgi:hypothetical protein